MNNTPTPPPPTHTHTAFPLNLVFPNTRTHKHGTQHRRCIRQRLYNISRDQHWREAHGVLFGERKDIGSDATYR